MGLYTKDAMVTTYCPTKVVMLSINKFTESTGNFKITFDTPQCDHQSNDCTDRYLECTCNRSRLHGGSGCIFSGGICSLQQPFVHLNCFGMGAGLSAHVRYFPGSVLIFVALLCFLALRNGFQSTGEPELS